MRGALSIKKMNIDPSLSNATTDLKCIIDLNIRTKDINLLGKKKQQEEMFVILG